MQAKKSVVHGLLQDYFVYDGSFMRPGPVLAETLSQLYLRQTLQAWKVESCFNICLSKTKKEYAHLCFY